MVDGIGNRRGLVVTDYAWSAREDRGFRFVGRTFPYLLLRPLRFSGATQGMATSRNRKEPQYQFGFKK